MADEITRNTTEMTRMERLDWLESWLKSDEMLVLKDAASEIGVSLRTISRDIALLRARGLPVGADRGRGGGVRLDADWRVGRIALRYREAIDLLIGMAVMEAGGTMLPLSNAAAIRRKLVATFSRRDQGRLRRLRQRVRIGGASSPEIAAGFSVVPQPLSGPLQEAFLMMREAEIQYRDVQGRQTLRTVEPHYLLLHPPAWYLLCFDRLRNDIRTFRSDRVGRVRLGERRFQLRPLDAFEQAMAGYETRGL